MQNAVRNTEIAKWIPPGGHAPFLGSELCRPDCGLNRSDCQDVADVASVGNPLQGEEGRGVKGKLSTAMRGRKFRLLETPMRPGKFDSSKSSIR